jgi:flagellar biosynthesis anti-sigma factor FlgM
MKIQNTTSPSVYSRPGVGSTTKGGATGSVSSGTSGAKRSGGTTDAASVSLSPEARALAAGGNVNEAKVSAIKAQVDAGEYEVDAYRVAERMIDSV